jgi:hypothetical protein
MFSAHIGRLSNIDSRKPFVLECPLVFPEAEGSVVNGTGAPPVRFYGNCRQCVLLLNAKQTYYVTDGHRRQADSQVRADL